VIRINLLAPGTGPQASAWRRWFVVPPEQRAALVGLTMLMVTAVTVAGWWWSIDRERRVLDTEITAAETQMARLQDVARLVEQTAARERDLRERLALIERLRATQRAPVVLLDTISRALPEGLWLLELRQTGAQVQLEGRAVSLSALTDFVDRLQTSGRFVHTIDIVTTSMEALADTSVVRFAIRGEVRAPVAEPSVKTSKGGL
jgi:Tfp pilus assembly protein PilN